MALSGPADWAEAFFGSASGGYPGIAAVYVMLGDAYARGGNGRSALGSFRKALAPGARVLPNRAPCVTHLFE